MNDQPTRDYPRGQMVYPLFDRMIDDDAGEGSLYDPEEYTVLGVDERPEPAPDRNPSPPRGRAWSLLGNGLLVAGAIALAIGATEFLLRVFPEFPVPAGGREYIFCGASRTRDQSHPLFGHTEIPGNSYFERYSKADPWNYVRINAEGFRSNAGGTGEPVIVLGGSMARGSLVAEQETFAHLLGKWHPELSFRNYGTGGYGESNSLRLYKRKGADFRHTLVIQAISLSTDIEDNAERSVLSGDSVEVTIRAAGSEPGPNWPVRTHSALWRGSKLYRLVYTSAVQRFVANQNSRRDMNAAIEITRRLLDRLADEAQANGADLLLLILPGRAEMDGSADGLEPARQRQMIQAFAASRPGVSVVDPSNALVRAGSERTYGILDKHLTAYGHFIVARAVERWLITAWPGNSRLSVPSTARTFEPQPRITPDCSRAAEYLATIRAR